MWETQITNKIELGRAWLRLENDSSIQGKAKLDYQRDTWSKVWQYQDKLSDDGKAKLDRQQRKAGLGKREQTGRKGSRDGKNALKVSAIA